MDDLIIVGAGWAGLTGAAYALERGAKTRLIAQGIGSLVVLPGWISVLDSTPGDLLAALRALPPDHPYALVGAETTSAAFEFFRALTAKIDLPYEGNLAANRRLPNALGAWATPAFTPPGYSAEAGAAPLFVGFKGWRDYYPALSGGRIAWIEMPDRPWDASPTDLARRFDDPAFREKVAAQVRSQADGATSAGFPAVIGLEDPAAAVRDLSARIGLPVFEIPTLPPSVPGTRLFNRLRRYLLDHRVRVQIGHPVARGIIEDGRAVGVEVAAAGKPQLFRARAILLATGGLYGGGLFSDDRGRIWEPIFGLPVKYNPDRSQWFSGELLDARGHAVHYFGVRANTHMQPLNADGSLAAAGLYVAGHILAHPEAGPSPLDTAEGVAIATAYRAVDEALKG